MTSAEPLFVDTNVLIYANVATAPFHEAALKSLQYAHQAKRPLWISRQVLSVLFLLFALCLRVSVREK